MTFGIAITAAPRRIPSLAPSVLSLRNAGFSEPVHVLADGACGLVSDAATSVVQNDPPLGTLGNAFAALAWLMKTRMRWLLLLEDDIVWAYKARAALQAELGKLPDDTGCVVLYVHPSLCRRLKDAGRDKPGYHDLSLGYESLGAQAMLFPRQAAEALVNSDWRQHTRNRDRVIPGLLKGIGHRTLYRVPSLVNHSPGSGNSSVKPKKPQDTQLFEDPAQAVTRVYT